MKDGIKKWYALDNAAKIYPPSASRIWMSMFRLSATLDAPVEPEILKKALKSTLARFPGLSVRLRRGVFWYYLEQLNGEPEIQKDVQNPLLPIDFKKNRGFMFRVRYHENRVALEFFHVLTDGGGGMIFLKTLLAEYTELKYGVKIPRDNTILDCTEKPKKEELADGFLKHARPTTESRHEESSYRLKGSRLPRGEVAITTGVIPTEKLILEAKKHGATVTEYLCSVMIYAIYQIQNASLGNKNKLVKICVPANLRKFYPTNTLRNFSAFVNIGINPRWGEYTLEEIIEETKHRMRLYTTEKYLNVRMSTNVKSEESALIRIIPLFVKNIALKIAFNLDGDRTSSTTLSNMGVVDLPSELKEHIERFDFVLGPLPKNPLTCACVSYKEKTYLSVTRSIEETDFERLLFTTLIKSGIPVLIENNEIQNY